MVGTGRRRARLRHRLRTIVASHGAEPQLADPLRVVVAERAVGPDERVLGDLLGVVRVAGHAQGDRVAAVHVGLDEVLERAVEVAREALR